jgi:hypothetical protein
MDVLNRGSVDGRCHRGHFRARKDEERPVFEVGYLIAAFLLFLVVLILWFVLGKIRRDP